MSLPRSWSDFLGSRGTTPPILNLSVRWRSVITVSPRTLCLRERTPVLTEWEAGWARRLTRPFGKRDLSYTGIWTPDRSVHYLVCIPSTLSQLKVSHRTVRLFHFVMRVFLVKSSLKKKKSVKFCCQESGDAFALDTSCQPPVECPLRLSYSGSSSDSRTRQYYQPEVTVYFCCTIFTRDFFFFATAADLIRQVAPTKVNYVFCNNFRE